MILGPLRVRGDAGEITLTAARDRTVLATLLLHVGETVSVPALVEAVWGSQPPGNARNQIQGCVSRLRKQLASAGAKGRVIVTDPAGYRAVVDAQDLDLSEFRRLRDEARAAVAVGHAVEAGQRYRTALGLWHGSALAGIESALLRRAAMAVDEERLRAIEECLETELSLGKSGELVPELTELVRQHPYQEKLHGALMLALYRAGRQADALTAYRRLRWLLHDELGAEPGDELQRLHRAILSRDPDLSTPPALPPPSPAKATPRELPAQVAAFTGRTQALAELDSLLPGDGSPPVPVVISAIAGTAGVGKTALAVHWAHRIADRFPNGQLYVNLRGYDPDQPIPPADVLARFLTTLGVASQELPLDLDDRAARYRSELAGRRMLIVLDNASSVDQVRPLLPGGGSSVVVVTSRDSLAGLVAVHGAHRLVLDLLPLAEATTLLLRLVGARVDAAPDAATALANLCARLPLALRIAAELAISRPAVPLAELVNELADRQRRMDLLDAGGDPHAAMKVVFSWSDQHLLPEVAHTFRLLGLHPGPSFDMYATAALTGTDLEQALHALGRLARANLIHPAGPGRYGMHDLLRTYAAHLAAKENSDTELRTALSQLFDYYLATAAAAMNSLFPAEVNRRPQVAVPGTPMPDLTSPATALAWIDAELSCLASVVTQSASHGWSTHTMRLSSTLYRYLDGGHYDYALAIHGHAYHAAQQVGDLAQQAHALRNLGATHWRKSRYDLAADHLHQALTLFRKAGDQIGEALTLINLGTVSRKRGHHKLATDRFEQALALFQQVGDHLGEATALASLGAVEQTLGRYGPAADHHRQAILLYQKLGSLQGEAAALDNLGIVQRRLGRYGPAADHHRQAILLYQKLGNIQGEAAALDNLGTIHLRLGQPEQAAELFAQARDLLWKIGDRAGEAWTLNGLGEAASAAGDPTVAVTHHADALSLATEIEARDQQARAHAGLGQAHGALGELTRARLHYEHALTLFTTLDMPEAAEVSARLAALPIPTRSQ